MFDGNIFHFFVIACFSSGPDHDRLHRRATLFKYHASFRWPILPCQPLVSHGFFLRSTLNFVRGFTIHVRDLHCTSVVYFFRIDKTQHAVAEIINVMCVPEISLEV